MANLKKSFGSSILIVLIVSILIGTDLPKRGVSILWSSLIMLIPGIYALVYAVIFKEIKTRTGKLIGYKAIVFSIIFFGFFTLFGLPMLLIYFGYPNYYNSWWILCLSVILFIFPSIIVELGKKKHVKIPAIDYWIQTADIDVKEFDAVSLIEAQKVIKNYEWEKEILKSLNLEQLKKDNCPPTIGFNFENTWFNVSSSKIHEYDIYSEIPRKKGNLLKTLFIPNQKKEIKKNETP